MLGTATFGIDAALAVSYDAWTRGAVPRVLALVALAAALAAAAGGLGGSWAWIYTA
jgi:hypothetical protein